MEITIASYVRALIRNEAEAQGIRVGSIGETSTDSLPEDRPMDPHGSKGSTLEDTGGE